MQLCKGNDTLILASDATTIKLWDTQGTGKTQSAETVPDLFSMLELATRIDGVHATRYGEDTYFVAVQGQEFTVFKNALEEVAKQKVNGTIEFVQFSQTEKEAYLLTMEGVLHKYSLVENKFLWEYDIGQGKSRVVVYMAKLQSTEHTYLALALRSNTQSEVITFKDTGKSKEDKHTDINNEGKGEVTKIHSNWQTSVLFVGFPEKSEIGIYSYDKSSMKAE